MIDFIYLYSFLGSFSVIFVLMPFGLRIARKFNFIDSPNSRKVHSSEVPTGGGLIIFFGIFLSLLVFSFYFPEYLKLSFAYFCGLLIMFVIGLMDDKNDLKPKLKLLAQLVSSIIFIALSGQFFSFDFMGNKIAGILLTIFFIVSVINAYNLIDGLDGLASGLGIITISSLLLILDSEFKIIFFSIIGILFAFLRRNSYPAKIFLGDTGSYMLGYSISVLGLLVVGESESFNYIFILVIFMGIPVIDTTYAFIRRMLKGESVFKADKKHIHHLLLSYNISHRDSVSTLYIFQSVLVIIALCLSGYGFENIYLIVMCVLIVKHIMTIYDIRPISFVGIFKKIKILNKAYIYFFCSIIILFKLLAIQNSIILFDVKLLYVYLLILFISLLFILDKRTRKNNNIDISIVLSSVVMLYLSFNTAESISSDNWIYIIKQYLWYPIIFGLILSVFGIFKDRNDLFESPTEFLLLFYIIIIMPIGSFYISLFLPMKILMLLVIYKIILQDKIIREFNLIHFMNILMLFFLILYNI